MLVRKLDRVLLIISLSVTVGCVGKALPIAHYSDANGLLRQLSHQEWRIVRADGRQTKLRLATEGLKLANQCVVRFPNLPDCYYYRAIFTGRYYAVRIFGYQSGLKKMLADSRKIIQLDPTYRSGAAYRIMADIYTQVPAMALRPDAIVRDLDRAEKLLNTALDLVPNDPDNLLSRCRTRIVARRWAEAELDCKAARRLIKHQPNRANDPEWQKEMAEAEKRLARSRR